MIHQDVKRQVDLQRVIQEVGVSESDFSFAPSVVKLARELTGAELACKLHDALNSSNQFKPQWFLGSVSSEKFIIGTRLGIRDALLVAPEFNNPVFEAQKVYKEIVIRMGKLPFIRGTPMPVISGYNDKATRDAAVDSLCDFLSNKL